MQKLQTQGVHHITLVGADRQTSIDFWEGVLGMPFLFEQPNLDSPEQNHLYFDPGDGRLITVFTSEDRKADATPNPTGIGNLHHLAFIVSRASYSQAAQRLDQRGISHSGEVDRGFMHSIYFRDPLGQLMELACYKFDPPAGASHADVLHEAREDFPPHVGGIQTYTLELARRLATCCEALEVIAPTAPGARELLGDGWTRGAHPVGSFGDAHRSPGRRRALSRRIQSTTRMGCRRRTWWGRARGTDPRPARPSPHARPRGRGGRSRGVRSVARLVISRDGTSRARASRWPFRSSA